MNMTGDALRQQAEHRMVKVMLVYITVDISVYIIKPPNEEKLFKKVSCTAIYFCWKSRIKRTN